MTSKQRAFLRGLAMNIQPLATIGKNGITENVIKQINDLLEARELVKITVLPNSDAPAKALMEELAQATGAQAVQTVGSKITLFRISRKDDIQHILLPR